MAGWKTRRNEPSVEGAYPPDKTLPIAPLPRQAMSSMLSASAAMPANSEEIFNPALRLACGHPHVHIGQLPQPGPPADTRFRLIERCGDHRGSARQSNLRGALHELTRPNLDKSHCPSS